MSEDKKRKLEPIIISANFPGGSIESPLENWAKKYFEKDRKYEIPKYMEDGILMIGSPAIKFRRMHEPIVPLIKSMDTFSIKAAQCGNSFRQLSNAMFRMMSANAGLVISDYNDGIKRKVLYVKYPFYTKAQIRKILKGE